MTKRRAFIIQYEQSLGEEADPAKPGWSEHKEISVRVTSDALTGGWIQQFGKHPIDYLLLNVIALHARPLTDGDIEMLRPFGLATSRDLGKLFAYITDTGLADILRVDRKTVAASTQQLALDGHLIARALDSDAQIRLSGRFNGNAIYILSGRVAIRKEIIDRETGIHRDQILDTVDAHRDQILDTVNPVEGVTVSNFSPAVSNISPHRVQDFRTNRRGGGEEEEHSPQSISADDPAFARFRCHAPDYVPDDKDIKALASLRRERIPDDILLAAIDDAFSRPRKPRKFAYCAAIARDLSRNSDQPQAAAPKPEAEAAPAAAVAESRPTSRAGEGEADAEAGNAELPPELAEAVALYASLTGKSPPGNDDINRLSAMAAGCDPAARARDSTGAAWTLRALRLAVQADDPLAYTKAVLDDWIENGLPDVRSRRAPAAKRTRSGNGAEKQKRWDELIDA